MDQSVTGFVAHLLTLLVLTAAAVAGQNVVQGLLDGAMDTVGGLTGK